MHAHIADLLEPFVKRMAALKSSSPPLKVVGAFADRFGGAPFMLVGEDWPGCLGCREPMSFVAQIGLPSDVIHAPNGAQALVFFMCLKCGLYEHKEGDTVCVRTYRADELASGAARRPPRADPHVRERSITSTPGLSLPSWDMIDRVVGSAAVTEACEAVDPAEPWKIYQQVAARLVGEQEIGSQLGGYPCGPQGGLIPLDGCVLLAQFDGLDEAIDFSMAFGDAGVVQIFMDEAPPHATFVGFESC